MLNQDDSLRVASFFVEQAALYTLPHVMMRPRIFPDEEAWCALYGENIQEGVCGYGRTPEEAANDFDHVWYYGKTKIKD